MNFRIRVDWRQPGVRNPNPRSDFDKRIILIRLISQFSTPQKLATRAGAKRQCGGVIRLGKNLKMVGGGKSLKSDRKFAETS